MSNQFPPPAKSSPATTKSGAGAVVVVIAIVLGGLLFVALAIGALLLALLLPAISAARTAAGEAQHMSEMRRLGIAYQMYWDATNEGPQSWDDFRDINALDAEIIAALQERDIEVVWRVDPSVVGRGRLPASQIVLAFPNDPTLDGESLVSVLMADGSVSKMRALQVQQSRDAWEAEQARETEKDSAAVLAE